MNNNSEDKPMNSSYSQFKAMMAITRASLQGTLRSPSAVIFGILFPLVFILVFGFIGGGGMKMYVALQQGADTSNLIYKTISKLEAVKLISYSDNAELADGLSKGKVEVLMDIQPKKDSVERFDVKLYYSQANATSAGIFKLIVERIIDKHTLASLPNALPIASIEEKTVEIREYKRIDFILPGMLGFSLLSTGVFGTAFVFITMRQTLVLKRFFATPIRKAYIVLGEALSRLIFSLMGATVILTIGYFAFDFTLIHGFYTALQMLILSALGSIVFMGCGFLVSGIAKNESVVPLIANLFTMPQLLLAGTFFPIAAFPSWLQPISKSLPLTYLNDALREVAFEGAGFTAILPQIGIVCAWGVLIYALAVKFFRWE